MLILPVVEKQGVINDNFINILRLFQRGKAMRMIIRPLIFLCLAFFMHTAQAQKWYEGGTLHQATLAEWKQATPENKLATLGDMVSAMYSQEKLVPAVQNAIKNGRMEAIKKIAQSLVEQVDEVSSDKESSGYKVPDIVVTLMLLNGIVKA